MTAKLLPAAFVFVSLLGGAGVPSAQASTPSGEDACVFDKFRPVSVAPYTSENSIDWGSYSFLGGAQLFVPAREGLTKEWLAASVQQAIASAGGDHAVCGSPRVQDVHVKVVSGGHGFWVQLIGRDETTSKTLLDWANSIVARGNRTASR